MALMLAGTPPGLICSFLLVCAAPSLAEGLQNDVMPEDRAVGPWHVVESRPAEAPYTSLLERLDGAAAELRLGHPNAVIEILTERDLPWNAAGRRARRLLGKAYLSVDSTRLSASVFDELADRTGGRESGVGLTWAARAYETGGFSREARDRYIRAAELLPSISSWLLMRAARHESDPAKTLELLLDAPASARMAAQNARAEAYLRLGDSVEAIDRYTSIDEYLPAAALSDSLGHEALTRELLFAAMAQVTDRDAVTAADIATERFPPTVWREYDLIARALGRHGRARDAVPLLEEWISGGDSSDVVYHLLGIMREASGDRRGALAAWETAASGDHARAGESEYRRIRLMVRMRRQTAARTALRGFIARFADHRRTPWAMYLLGDLMWDVGIRQASDSVFLALSDAFPGASNTPQARYRLAMRSLLRADTTGAIERLAVAAAGSSESSRTSGYQLGVLMQATGDSTGARAAWGRLARTDSVGYYGMVARRAAGLPAPVFESSVIPEPSAAIKAVVQSVSLLDQLGFDADADALVSYTIADGGFEPEDLLSFAESLIDTGRSIRAIRLGWVLSRHFTLNHPRVVRVIFPFPNRSLVMAEAEKFALDPYLVAGMIRQESAFDVSAVSRAGARGLMQLMPATARGTAGSLGVASWNNRFLNVADANVHLGTAHLAALIRQYDGDVEITLAAYNAGGTPVRRWLRYPELSDKVRWIERISYPETRGYLKTVLRNRDLYRALYGPASIP